MLEIPSYNNFASIEFSKDDIKKFGYRHIKIDYLAGIFNFCYYDKILGNKNYALLTKKFCEYSKCEVIKTIHRIQSIIDFECNGKVLRKKDKSGIVIKTKYGVVTQYEIYSDDSDWIFTDYAGNYYPCSSIMITDSFIFEKYYKILK